MRIQLISPADSRYWSGNRVTAERWARILRELGHRVAMNGLSKGSRCDLLIALHARRSADAVFQSHKERPEVPIIVCLTGTDLYRDIRPYRRAQRVLELASRLILLQPLGVSELPAHLHEKTRVILQSVPRLQGPPKKAGDAFEVCVIGNLRPVKDPFRTAMAARLLPKSSRVRVLHVGRALSESMERRARAEEARNPRYRWLRDKSRWQALRILARSRALVLTSRMEGGANVISEALAASVPVLASRIPGSVGLLGEDYPGFFPAGDARALARLLARMETDPHFTERLRAACARLAPDFDPVRERDAWESLLEELKIP
ncbi:MAG: TIGR04348 family glycosyltransferase [Candidatus Tectomicrobia bacterium]|nr:TIGR04348 family glycosyltransferase [Candidatus Tectomicrobia bacterium]